MTSNPRRRRARPRKRIIRPPNYAPNRARRNPMPIGVSWTGHKANFISPKGNYGIVPSSELAISTRIADKPVVQFALFSDAKRWPHVTWAHVMTPDGFVTDGLPSEVLPAEVRRTLGFGNEKMPKGASRKQAYVPNPSASDDNPRKAHRLIVGAFLAGRSMRLGATKQWDQYSRTLVDKGVSRYKTDGKTLWAWGNVVAAKQADGIMLRDAGWRTLLTKNVLNELLQQMGIPGSISQVRNVWMLGGKPWPGSVVAPYKTLPTNGTATNPQKRRVYHKRSRQLPSSRLAKRSFQKNPLIKGANLSYSQRQQVLSAFGYRWTVENEVRARSWFASGGHKPPTMRLETDAQWLKNHAFWFTADGRLQSRRRHAEPVYMADDPEYSKRHNPKRNPCGSKNPLKQYAVYRFQHREMKSPQWGAVEATGNWRDFLPATVLSKPGILGFVAHSKSEAIEKGKEEFALHGGNPKKETYTWTKVSRPNPSSIKYRTVETRTLKGLKEAEKLHREGWSMGRVGPFTTQFYRRRCKKCGGWMKTQGKWKGVEKFECGKCGDEQKRRCEMNPRGAHHNASRLYKARWGQAGQPDIVNVSFEARSDYAAKLRADKIAREQGVTRIPRTITRFGGGIIECRTSGTSSNPRSCKMCGGPLVKMGGLGNLMWYRCRNCGMETSVKR